MKPRRARSIAMVLVRVAICLAGAQYIAPRLRDQLSARPRSSSQAVQSKSQKLANPLNDLLDEAQRDIDKNDFEAAIPPLQKFLVEKPDIAYGHFQLAYV
jgi:hypothetical protein